MAGILEEGPIRKLLRQRRGLMSPEGGLGLSSSLKELIELLDYWEVEAKKALEVLREMHLPKDFFAFTYRLGDIVEYEGAAVAAFKAFPEDLRVRYHYFNAKRIHESAYRERDRLHEEMK